MNMDGPRCEKCNALEIIPPVMYGEKKVRNELFICVWAGKSFYDMDITPEWCPKLSKSDIQSQLDELSRRIQDG